jgi:hypothetical protein
MVAEDEDFSELIVSMSTVASVNTQFTYLYGTHCKRVYMNKPHSLEELQANIRHEISAISI